MNSEAAAASTAGARPSDLVDNHAVDTPAATDHAVDIPAIADPGVADPAGEVGSGGSAELRDSLPEDLNVSGYVGPYKFPNNSRRRIPGIIYIAIGMGGIGLSLAAGTDAVLVNRGFVVGGIALILFGLYHLQAGWHLAVDEKNALMAAARQVKFPVGHASAQLAWRGLRSRPTWRILLYSNEAPPSQRGLVLVDGVDGKIVDSFVEENPEDWSKMGD